MWVGRKENMKTDNLLRKYYQSSTGETIVAQKTGATNERRENQSVRETL